jgi:hypothetical protein
MKNYLTHHCIISRLVLVEMHANTREILWACLVDTAGNRT